MSIIKTPKDEEKGRLRKLALSQRNSLSEAQRQAAGQKIAAAVLAHPAVNQARTIMCYRSYRSEVPTDEIVSALQKQGKTLCFPLCGKLGIMWAYQPLSNEAWKSGMMGIMEPDVEKSRLVPPEEIDLVICPMVGFDRDKRRMGYGGGYYDRYLPQCTKAFVMGIAFEAQRMEQIITDEFDRPVDIVITEEKEY